MPGSVHVGGESHERLEDLLHDGPIRDLTDPLVDGERREPTRVDLAQSREQAGQGDLVARCRAAVSAPTTPHRRARDG